VQYSCEQMFALVNDIEAYPDYMEGCQSAQILQRGEGWVEARLTLGLVGQRQSFVTRNRLYPPSRMTLELVEGPFKHFAGLWQFTPLGEQGCKLSLQLDFALQNPLLAMLAGKFFEKMAATQVDAVSRRAREIYSPGDIHG